MENISIAHNNERASWIIAVCVVVCVTAVLVGFPLLLGVVPAGAQTVDSAALRAAALLRPTMTNPNGSVAQADGVLDLLTRDLSPQHPPLQAAFSLRPDPRVPSTASKLLAPRVVRSIAR